MSVLHSDSTLSKHILDALCPNDMQSNDSFACPPGGVETDIRNVEKNRTSEHVQCHKKMFGLLSDGNFVDFEAEDK